MTKIDEIISNISPTDVYTSEKFGNYHILEVYERLPGKKSWDRKCRVKFENTGYEYVIAIRDALNGKVRDPYAPTVYGVACLGEVTMMGDNFKLHRYWEGMLKRCYSDEKYFDHYNGCKVCDRWLCFANFLEDAPKLPGYDEMIAHPEIKYQLDKDELQANVPVEQRIYSPETCQWVTQQKNLHIAAAQNKYNKSCEYYGVMFRNNCYQVVANVKTRDGHYIGRFDDPVAAVNAYEYHRWDTNSPIIGNENYPKMDMREVLQHKIRSRLLPPLEQLYTVHKDFDDSKIMNLSGE